MADYFNSRGKILIIDSAPDLSNFLITAMEVTGYEVILLSHGEAALSQATTLQPDLILLEVALAGAIDGFETCIRLKTHPETSAIPIVFLTSLNETTDKLHAFSCGANDYITKPLDIAEALARIESQLLLRRLQKQLRLQNELLTQEVHQRLAAESALQESNHKLQMLANIDGLTQLANRRYFDEFYANEWQRAMLAHNPLALIMTDVDYFKKYNDTYGHLEGDNCLKQIAQIINSSVMRTCDLVARYGGEEFVVVLPNTEIAGAIKVAENIQEKLKTARIPHSASEVNNWVTASFGVASILPTPNMDSKDLILYADQSLYRAKQSGRDRICVHYGS